MNHEQIDQAPDYGIYFLYEKGEYYSQADGSDGRIVRVGISKILHERLRSEIVSGGTVLRMHLGSALLKRDGACATDIERWYHPKDKVAWRPENVKRQFLEYVQQNFTVRCLEVADQRLRVEYEKQLIYELAQCKGCIPSDGWLGHMAYNEKVRQWGLWNHDHTDDNPRLQKADLDSFHRFLGLS
ncbi:MAG: hypothetical protein HYY02_06835 [Chloroflexi bacterium]|nr:hypothetical protein [Chloroflexota bacterium]